MAGENRIEDDRMSYVAQLSAVPHAFDFYQALRRLEALHPDAPRIGDALRPADEAVRFAQEPSLAFAPANLARFEIGASGVARLGVRFLGLFGPQGALPLHITELARERLRHHGDPTLSRFLDVFHHRLLSLFYKAWRQAQPTACHDRPQQDRFRVYLNTTFGGNGRMLPGRDQIPDHVKRYFAGHLGQTRRHADGLVAILVEYFAAPVSLEPFHAQWMPLPQEQRSRLGGEGNSRLRRNAVIGKRVWDAQHHFLLRIGPLSFAQYQDFLPGRNGANRLHDWVSLYTAREFEWGARLLLKQAEVPALQPGRGRQLGWSTWLGRRPRSEAVEGLLLKRAHAAASPVATA